MAFNDKDGHAEENLLRNIGNYESNAILVSLRVTNNGSFGMAKPCVNCTRLIKMHTKLSYVKWSNKYTKVNNNLVICEALSL